MLFDRFLVGYKYPTYGCRLKGSLKPYLPSIANTTFFSFAKISIL